MLSAKRFRGQLVGLVGVLSVIAAGLAAAAPAAQAGGFCSHVLAFSQSSYSVDEGQAVTVTVTDTHTSDATNCSDSFVDYATSDGTARQPGDYTPARGTLRFPGTVKFDSPNPTAKVSQTFVVPTVDNHRQEGPLNFALTLSNPKAFGNTFESATLGSPSSAQVTIRDVDRGPVATSGTASGVTPVSATLNGTVNPQGQATTYHFEYGTSTAYGQRTADAGAGSDSTDHAESAGVSGLQPLTTYHFRVVASNAAGTSAGADQMFTTSVLAPAVMTLPASTVGQTTATLNGSVNPNGVATSYHFDYGTSTSYGTSTPTQSAGSGTSSQPVSAARSGLVAGTTYHFRLVASSATGSTSGGDRTFTTATPAPPPPKPKLLPPSITDTGQGSTIASSGGLLTIPGVAVNCPGNGGACSVSATLTTRTAAGSAISAARANPVIGKITLTTAAHSRTSVRIRLNALGRRLLGARRHLLVHADLRARNRAGTTRRAKAFMLRARPTARHRPAPRPRFTG